MASQNIKLVHYYFFCHGRQISIKWTRKWNEYNPLADEKISYNYFHQIYMAYRWPSSRGSRCVNVPTNAWFCSFKLTHMMNYRVRDIQIRIHPIEQSSNKSRFTLLGYDIDTENMPRFVCIGDIWKKNELDETNPRRLGQNNIGYKYFVCSLSFHIHFNLNNSYLVPNEGVPN